MPLQAAASYPSNNLIMQPLSNDFDDDNTP